MFQITNVRGTLSDSVAQSIAKRYDSSSYSHAIKTICYWSLGCLSVCVRIVGRLQMSFVSHLSGDIFGDGVHAIAEGNYLNPETILQTVKHKRTMQLGN